MKNTLRGRWMKVIGAPLQCRRWSRVPIVLSCITMVFIAGCAASSVGKSDGRQVIVYQPSHQTDTGVDFSEAAVCNGIAEAAIAAHSDRFRPYKTWSYNVSGLRYARQGSNTMIEHTSREVGDSLTGYAWEVSASNDHNPTVFVSIHNNGGTHRHAVWGFIHEGDTFQDANRELAARLVEALAASTGLENRGVHYDSSVGRNDYRCRVTGKQAFYSLDENVNKAPYRVLLEIGDNDVSRDFLEDPAHQRAMGKIIANVVESYFNR